MYTDPPSILYTTEYVIHQESEFGTSGHLSCAVETSADTQSHVTWWANGKELQEGDKYRMSSSEMSKEVRLFQLAVEKVQHSDIGSYLCQLSSDYNIEESQEAWIKVDYRKGIQILVTWLVMKSLLVVAYTLLWASSPHSLTMPVPVLVMPSF